MSASNDLPPTQSTFSFSKSEAFAREDYIISPGNRYATSLIHEWPQWKGQITLLYGPKASGKTHLAHIWSEHACAKELSSRELYRHSALDLVQTHTHLLIENIENIHDETVLFHLFNAVRETAKATLLMTAKEHPSRLNIRLPDLYSRLISAQLAALELPDETMLYTLFAKHFSDRQLKVSSDVMLYLASRCERSYNSVALLVAQLDLLALTCKRNITIPFIRDMSETLGLDTKP
jgi:chromosomal replication initiation ATPase DnaA